MKLLYLWEHLLWSFHKVKVMGNLPVNNSWTNIALRWEPLLFQDQGTFNQLMADNNDDISKLGGLQLFLNLELVAQSLLPEVSQLKRKDSQG